MPSVQLLDFEDIGLLVRHGRLYAIPVRRASVLPAASFRAHLATATLPVRLTIDYFYYLNPYPCHSQPLPEAE